MGIELTQAELKRLVEYDPETGLFRSLPGRQGVKAGSVLGVPKNGYLAMYLNHGRYYAHRLAWLYMTGSWPSDGVDHINRDRTDNRWCNLRAADQSENMANAGIRKDNTTGYRGVYPHQGGFRARITFRGERRCLGVYPSLEEAALAYQQAARATFGKFAAINGATS